MCELSGKVTKGFVIVSTRSVMRLPDHGLGWRHMTTKHE